MVNKEFDSFKDFVRDKVLQATKKLGIKERKDIRTLYDNTKEEKLENTITLLNLNHNLNLDYIDLANEWKEIQKKANELSKEDQKNLQGAYKKILELLKIYIDVEERYRKIIAIWIIGTYFHKNFDSYPYLYLNAMKGSGKTRTLKLICSLIPNGRLVVSMSEAVLFRSAKDNAFCIDEFENVGGKDKNALRELLNAAYKKGVGVERARKVNTPDGEDFIVERYEVYTPICIANIWGMEGVLGDRCIGVVLEKSKRKDITKLLEDFSPSNPRIQDIKDLLGVVCVCKIPKKTYTSWNDYYTTYHSPHTHTTPSETYIHNTYTTYTTHTTPLPSMIEELYKKLMSSNIEGRAFELFFPLFIVSNLISPDVRNDLIQIAENIVRERTEEDILENPDMSLYEYISTMPSTLGFIPISILLTNFKEFLKQDNEETKNWLNSSWLGRSLKRLNLVVSKRRVRRGIEVIVNVPKAKAKIEQFKGELHTR